MATERYALNIAEIERSVENYQQTKPSYSFTLHRKDTDRYIYKVEKDGENVTFIIYLQKGGMVSHQVQGKDNLSHLKSVAEGCWEYVVDKTHIRCVSCNIFKFKDVKEDDFTAFTTLFSEHENYSIEDIESLNEHLKYRKQISDTHGAKVFANYYSNGTMTLQGGITPLFTYAWAECVDMVGDLEAEEKEAFLSYSTTQGEERIAPDINTHIENIAPINGTKIEMFIQTSIRLANLGLAEGDCGWIPFCILKGLDALVSMKLTGGNPLKDFERYSDYFVPDAADPNKFVFKKDIHDYDGNTPLKSALENGYTLLRNKRNSTFHIDRLNPESSTTLTYEMAVELVEETLRAINLICKNW